MALADSLGKVASSILKSLGADVTIRYVTAGSYNTSTGAVSEMNSKPPERSAYMVSSV
jgi:hypothetical protein